MKSAKHAPHRVKQPTHSYLRQGSRPSSSIRQVIKAMSSKTYRWGILKLCCTPLSIYYQFPVNVPLTALYVLSSRLTTQTADSHFDVVPKHRKTNFEYAKEILYINLAHIHFSELYVNNKGCSWFLQIFIKLLDHCAVAGAVTCSMCS